MKRWKCPRCGAGRLAPSRMARDDVRRWCLTCSAELPKLQPMICPALEAARERKKTEARERAKAKRDAERAAEAARFTTKDGYDVRTLFHTIQNLRTWRDESPRVARAVGSIPIVDLRVLWSAKDRVAAEMSLFGLCSDRVWQTLPMSIARTDSNLEAIDIAAASEYYGIPVREIREVWEVGRRLASPRERANKNVRWGIEQAVRAKRKAGA